jgi:hypothetical protein
MGSWVNGWVERGLNPSLYMRTAEESLTRGIGERKRNPRRGKENQHDEGIAVMDSQRVCLGSHRPHHAVYRGIGSRMSKEGRNGIHGVTTVFLMRFQALWMFENSCLWNPRPLNADGIPRNGLSLDFAIIDRDCIERTECDNYATT